MAGLTPISGASGFTRIVPVPCPELESLPPASPLPLSEEAQAAEKPGEVGQRQANPLMRWTPSEPPGPVEPEQAARPVGSADGEATEAETTRPAPARTPELGSYLDTLG